MKGADRVIFTFLPMPIMGGRAYSNGEPSPHPMSTRNRCDLLCL